MKTGIVGLLLCGAMLLGGCAAPRQEPLPLNGEVVALKSSRVGVVMTALPKVDISFPGANCLLCMAAAVATNLTLATHTQTLPYEDLPVLKDQVVALLRKKGIDATLMLDDLDLKGLSDFGSKGPNIARKDHTALRQKYNIDKLIVIQINALGVQRTYSSYFPTGEPRGYMLGLGYMVNLSNNNYEWYAPLNVAKSADGPWDEPPNFPGLTNAYFQVLEVAKDSFRKPFLN